MKNSLVFTVSEKVITKDSEMSEQSNEILCEMYQKGNKRAAHYLCIKNERLVSSVALKYLHVFGNKLEAEDLMQSGFTGLIRAAEKYDRSFNSQFSTYAVLWIKQSVIREMIDAGFNIRIPVHVFEKISVVSRFEKALESSQADSEKIKEIILEQTNLSEEEIDNARYCTNTYFNGGSLNSVIGDGSEIIDFIEDEDYDIEKEIGSKILASEISEILSSCLNPKEKCIIEKRFGLGDGRVYTLEEVGAELNVTRERVRQIEANTLQKLRTVFKRKGFSDYIYA